MSRLELLVIGTVLIAVVLLFQGMLGAFTNSVSGTSKKLKQRIYIDRAVRA